MSTTKIQRRKLTVVLAIVLTLAFWTYKTFGWLSVKNSTAYATAMQLITKRHPDSDQSSIKMVAYSKSRHYKDEGFDSLVLTFSIEGNNREELFFKRTNGNHEWALVEDRRN